MSMSLGELQQEIAKARKELKKYQTKADMARVRYETADHLYRQYEADVYHPLIEELARHNEEYRANISR